MSTNPDKDLETLVASGKKIMIAQREFEIRPFVLRNRIKFVKIVSDILMSVGSAIGPDIQNSPAKAIPILVEAAGEKINDVYAMVLGVDLEWCLDNLTIKDELAIWEAVLEVNDIPFIVRRIKEALPQVPASR